MSLAAGKLRHRIVIEQQTTRIDSSGVQDTFWAYVATVWAEIAPLSAREFIAGQQSQSEVVARITIRYRADVAAPMRIRHGSKIYNIQGAQPDRESGIEYLTLPCSQGVNDGA